MKFTVLLLGFAALSVSFRLHAQESKTRNIVVVTLDGYRWQELFEGADEDILFNEKYVKDTTVKSLFWDSSPYIRREKLMPFFWEVISNEGQLYGNRFYKNKVKCTNSHLLSYPGYSEMLVGFPDAKVSNNDKIENPNYTVLEYIHRQEDFRDQVAAFATWDAFPYILREEKSEIHVNAGNDIANGSISNREKKLNEMQHTSGREDKITFQYALEYMKRERPRVMFIGFDGTDTHAHGGRYDEYLKSAHDADKMLKELWDWLQSQDDYKDQTTLLITTDHGRGNGNNNWRHHRLLAPGSGQIWFAAMGPDTPAFGEMKFKSKYYQKQVAKTVAAFLGLYYTHRKPVGEVIQTMLAVPKVLSSTITAKQTVTEDSLDNK